LKAEDRLICAVDVQTRVEFDAAIERLQGAVSWIKIGSMMFASGGMPLVRQVLDHGFQVFLDLKLHDIPFQVGKTARVLSDLGAGLLTIHTSGGSAMMEAAVKAVEGTPTRLLGVTVLTSLSGGDLQSVGCGADIAQVVSQRAQLAVSSGVHGVVASAHEAGTLRASLPSANEIVTPGIRLVGDASGDQQRIATPKDAILAGATRLVVGRSILHAADPRETALAIVETIREVT